MYEFQRVFCALPVEMQEERAAFYAAVGDFNQEEAMRRGVLFVPVAASSALRAVAPADVRENIRACRYYIEVQPSGARDPENDPELSYGFAIQCSQDSSLPMREVITLNKTGFADLGEFKLRVLELLSRWMSATGAQSATA